MKKGFVLFMVLFMLMAIASGCSNEVAEVDEGEVVTDATDQTTNEMKGPKEVTIAIASDWQGTDHYQADEINQFQKLIGDSLIVLNSKLEISNNIASEVDIAADGTTVKITVPEGIAFGNGDPVTPEDVKASIEYGLVNSPYRWDYMNIVEITIEGNQVILKTDYYSSTMLYNFCSTYIPVAQKSQIDSLTIDKMLTESDQYGLFYVEEFVSGSHYTLLKNEGYKTTNADIENKGASNIDKVTIKIMPDGFSRVNALISGEIDIAAAVPAENIPQLESDPNISIIERPSPGMRFLSLNSKNPLFEDNRVREAIAQAINREQIEEANQKNVRVAYSFVVPEMLDYSQEAYDYYKETYSNNVEKAKQLLDDAGWKDTNANGIRDKDGVELEFSVMGGATLPDIKVTTQVLQVQMLSIGVKVNIETLDYSYLREKVSNGDYDAAFIGFAWIDPPSILPYMVKDEASVMDPTYFDRATESAFIQDKGERVAEIFAVQKILMDELYMIPLLQSYDYLAFNNRIVGLKLLPDLDVLFNDVDVTQ